MVCELRQDYQPQAEFRTVLNWDIDSPEAALLTRAFLRLQERRADDTEGGSVIARIVDGGAVLRVYYADDVPRALYVLGFPDEKASVLAAYSECGDAAVHKGSEEAAAMAALLGFQKLYFFSRRRGWERVAAAYKFTHIGDGWYEQEI